MLNTKVLNNYNEKLCKAYYNFTIHNSTSHFIFVEYRPFYVMAGIWRQNAKKNTPLHFPYGCRQQPQAVLTPSPRIAKGCNSDAPCCLQPRRNVRSRETTAAPRVNSNITQTRCFEVGLVSRPTASVAVAHLVTERLKCRARLTQTCSLCNQLCHYLHSLVE